MTDPLIQKAEAARLKARAETEMEKPKPETPREQKPKKPKKQAKTQGRDLEFDEIEPWETPVEGAALLDMVAKTFRRYIVLPKYGDVAAALWTVNTYLLDVAEAAPRLHIKSPVRECGKTQFLILLSALVIRPIQASSTTPSPVFRSIDAARPTLLLDEIDNAKLADNPELLSILNSGFTRSTANVLRAVGENHEPRQFSTWAAFALAGIGELPDTVASRSIVVPLKKKLASEKVDRIREGRIHNDLAHLRSRILRWSEDNSAGLSEADPNLPEELGDRAQDAWRPLVAIADMAGGGWPDLARDAAKTLSLGLDVEDAGTKIQLLADIRAVWKKEEEKAHTAALVKRLIEMEDRNWGECSHGRPLNQAGLAARLRGFVPPPKDVRIGDEVKKGWHRSVFEDAWVRYLAAPVAAQRGPTATLFPAPGLDCSGVAARTPPGGREDGL